MTAPAIDTEEQRPTALPAFAQRLNGLFDKLQDQGTKRTNEDAAEAITAAGTKISSSYIWLLRTGRRNNPGHHHIEALAAYFQVPAAYFFDTALAETIETELDLIAALRQPSVRRLATHAVGLPPGVLDALLVMVDQARQAQGLPALEHRVGLDEPTATR